MAQAPDDKPNLLQTLTNHRLGEVPAPRKDERLEPALPVEPRESREVEDKGRSPQEVLEQREPERRTQTDDDDAVLVRKYKVKGEELSLAEIAKRGMLEAIITSADQLPALTRKHQELLERVADKAVEKQPEKQPEAAPVQIPQAQIREHFMPMLKAAVEAGYIEPDFAEAYPDMSTGLMYYRTAMQEMNEKLAQVITWIGAEVKLRNARQVKFSLDSAIDAVAAKSEGDKGDKIFAGLKNPEIREAFTNWLRTDVDPKVGSLTPENIERFWLAFNANDLLNFTKEAAAKVETPPVSRRKAMGDGSPSRPGVPETPKEPSLLDRMSEMRLGPEA